jgi:sugar lactone lactonase YvrE
LRPQAIAANSFGRVFVADTGNDRVQVFDSEGEYVGQVGGFGWSASQFNRPTGITAEGNLDVWVADNQNRRLVRLTQDLVWVRTLESDAEGSPLGYPSDVTFNVDGWLWFTDPDGDRLSRLPQDGSVEGNSALQSVGVLVNPSGVSCGTDGLIIVADTGNNRIVAYDRFGSLLRTWGEGVLNHPHGVAVTERGDIVIADTQNDRLVFLNRLFQIVGTYGAAGTTEGSFSRPHDVSCDRAGRVFVADTGNDRIQIFRLHREAD